ncbi:PIN domain-containing protein [Candidatus Saccharibacteria bacterium]|nr:PIN domain-containing protein [Candidatus Saccharibacteria bacterium]
MKVLLDTNIIIDSLQSRKGFLEDAGQVMLRAFEYDGYLVASSITDIFYLHNRYTHDKKKAKESLSELFELFGVLDTTAEDCKNALRSEVADYEDAVIIESAKRNNIDCIVTRNTKDFVNSKIKAYSPVEFLRFFNQSR